MRTLIGIIGKGTRGASDPVPQRALDAAEEVGRLIAERDGVVLTGGLGGVMEAASKGAHQAGGVVVGLLPSLDRNSANPYVDIPLPTGLSTIRNHLTVRGSDAVIMIGGGNGTLNELTVCYGTKPVVVLEGTGGWADRIRNCLYEGKYLDERRASEIHFAQSATEAVDLVFRLAERAREA
jgi:uncharacterized protein (TIGR00725 family)